MLSRELTIGGPPATGKTIALECLVGPVDVVGRRKPGSGTGR